MIPGLPPRRELSAQQLAERAERDVALRLERDALSIARHRRLVRNTMIAMALWWLAMHGLITWIAHEPAWWLIGSALLGAASGWLLWRQTRFTAAMTTTALGIGWIFVARALGWCEPFHFFISGLFVTPFVCGAHVLGSLFASWYVDTLDRETMLT